MLRLGRHALGRARGRFGDLPIRSKILVPFVLLSLVYGASGTFVFARGTAAEARANLLTRLRAAGAVGVDQLEKREIRLADTTKLIAGTEGIAAAIVRNDRNALRRLALPPALSAGRALAVVTDAGGRSLLELRTEPGTQPAISADADWNMDPVRSALTTSGSRTGLVRSGDTWFLAVATVVVGDDGAQRGAVVVGDRLDATVREIGSLTKASVGFSDADGAVLAGRAQASDHDRRHEVLLLPVETGGQGVGTLTIALPSVSGLRALGGQGWKIAFLVIATLAGVFIAGLGVSRRISQPIGELVNSARALREGEMAHRVDVQGRDEVGQLAASFNEMAAQLQASHADLERRVEERTQELSDALTELDRTSRAKSALLANMSHEIRTPLSGIVLAAEMLSTGSPTSSRVKDLAHRIVRNSQHLRALLEELLDLSRIEAGHADLNVRAISVAEILKDAEGVIRPLAEAKGVDLLVPDVDGERLRVDPLRARQVLLNLLSNAVKFTEPGGRVWVEVNPKRGALAIAVRDTGIGIKRKDLARIFEPFERVSGSGRRGAGLGLAISRKITELHGGRLEATSRVGAGSTFTVTLPVAKEDA
jgi:signal transduction histidine kinase